MSSCRGQAVREADWVSNRRGKVLIWQHFSFKPNTNREPEKLPARCSTSNLHINHQEHHLIRDCHCCLKSLIINQTSNNMFWLNVKVKFKVKGQRHVLYTNFNFLVKSEALPKIPRLTHGREHLNLENWKMNDHQSKRITSECVWFPRLTESLINLY